MNSLHFERRLAICPAVLLALSTLATAQTTFQVDFAGDSQDSNPGDGVAADAQGRTSLRAAIQEANALGEASIITLTEGAQMSLSIAGAGEDAGATGDLDVKANITLLGRGATMSAAGLDRVFDVQFGGQLALSDLRIEQGAVTDASGGGVRNAGTFIATDVEWSGCTALGTGASGGGVFNDGGLATLSNCSFTLGDAERAGGAIEANAGSTVITDCTFEDNHAGPTPGNGGAFHLTGAGLVQVRNSTFSGNTADREGGALWNSGVGTMLVDGCTCTSNAALGTAADDGGGALFNDGGTFVVHDTVLTDNRADQGSGSGGGAFNREGLMFFEGGRIENNRANRAGGGIEASVGATRLLDLELRDNQTGPSPGNGGGLHLTGAGSVEVDACFVTGNFASAEGGGLWNSGSGSMIIRASNVNGNEAAGDASDQGGGGLFNDGGDMTVLSTRVAQNQATGTSGSGGGVFNNAGFLDMRFCRVVDNVSNRAGGGIEALEGTTELVFVRMSRNITGDAPGNGGAFHLTGAGMVTIQTSFVIDNQAGNEGGGLWNSSTGVMVVTHTNFLGNTAPTGPDVFNDGGTFTIDGTNVDPGP
jgi:hypothetical protein